MKFSSLFKAAAVAAVLFASPLARAGGVIIDGSVASKNDKGSDDDTENAKRHQIEQQLFLFVASVVNSPVIYVEEVGGTTPNPGPMTSQIVDDLGSGEQAGGCAAAPGSMLAMLGGLLLFRRRR